MKDITVNQSISIRDAMKALDSTAEKCLLVVDENNKLLGTLTDGDIRRSILSGAKFSVDISDCYNSKPITLVKGKYKVNDVKKLFNDKKIDLIPIIDQEFVVVDFVTWSTINGTKKPSKSLNDVSIIIMAGGKGSRLQPFTNVLPKPLVPVQEKPIIEHIIDRFSEFGCSHFYLSINYKGKILKAYFEDLEPAYKVNYIEEKEPLGTAGSLRLISGKFNKPFFVTNCDIIIKTDYAKLYDFHCKGGYDVTLVASLKEHIIPYGTCELNSDGNLSHINEKPHYDFLINTGLYVLNPDVLNLIPKDKFYHITHLIEDVKNNGKKVGIFPVDDDKWIDVGQWNEYKKVIDLL